MTVGKFLKRAIELRAAKPPLGDGPKTGTGMNVSAYIKELREAMDFMEMDQAFINRYLNQGFSGGEKKRMEVLQMLMLKPSIAILDETDSGLDIDALKVVGAGVNRLRGEGFGALVITHYRRILEIIVPDFVHMMYKGRIVDREARSSSRSSRRGATTGSRSSTGSRRKTMKSSSPVLDIAEYSHGYHYPDESVFRTREGLDEGVVNAISERKGEPEWMRQYRLRALDGLPQEAHAFVGRGPFRLDFDALCYYARPQEAQSRIVGRRARLDQGNLRADRHPRGRAEVPRRRRGPVRLRDGVPQHQGGPQRSSA